MIQKENASYRLLRDLGANGGYLGFYYAAAAIDAVLNSDGFYHQCKWIYNPDRCRLYLGIRKPGSSQGDHSLSAQ